MNTLVTDRPRVEQTARGHASEQSDPLVVRVVVVPTDREDDSVSIHHPALDDATSAMDDLACASWEDAEWQ